MKNTTVTANQTPLPYKLTNDYLFRAVFQAKPKALEGLCRSVLHLSKEDNVTVTLRNPIELGKTINSKEFILDLKVLVNNSLLLNLEMQMYKDSYWIERSILYTSRTFDNLNRGAKYSTVLPVIHVGFLNYDLFPDHPKFYATYQLKDNECDQVYSDKFRISVVNLNHIELATEIDKSYGIDLWVRMFKAATKEEINMLAQQNEYLKEAVSGVAILTEDEKIRQQCQAREDFEYWERMRENKHKRELEEKDKALAEKDNQYQQEIAELKARLAAIEASSQQN